MERIKVCVRVRPVREEDVAWHVGNQGRALVEPGSRQDKTWIFDRVFDEASRNADVFQETVADLIPRVLDGYHGTALVYGQTSSGKTYTMFGGDGPDAEIGAVQLGLEALFTATEARRSSHAFSVELSYVEVYNEVIGDLLAPTGEESGSFRTPHKRTPARRGGNAFQTPPSQQRGTPRTQGAVSVRDDLKGGVTLSALRKVANSVDEAMAILRDGASRRHVSSTGMNERSSRAHTILMVHVSSVSLEDGSRLSAQLNFVDLAGSESMRTSNAKGSQIAEAKNINQSLLALALAMANLAEGGGGASGGATGTGKGTEVSTPSTNTSRHVSFRTSKLTRILKPALSGDSLVCVICCITPAAQFKEESKRTLQFARTAARVPVQASKHESQAPEVTIEQLKKRIALLRAQSAPSLELREKENKEREEERERFRRLLLLAHSQQQVAADPERDLPLHLISPSLSTKPSASTRFSRKHRRVSVAGTPPTSAHVDAASPAQTPPIEQMYTRQLQQKVQAVKNALKVKTAALASAQQEIGELRALANEQAEDLGASQTKVADLQQAREALQQEHIARQAALVAEVVRLRQDVDDLAAKLAAAEEECAKRTDAAARAAEVTREVQVQLEAERDGLRLELANSQTQTGKARARLDQRERDIDDLQSVMRDLRRAKGLTEVELESLRSELDVVRAEKLQAQDAQAYLEEHGESLQREVSDLETQLEHEQTAFKQRGEELEKAQDAVRRLQMAQSKADEKLCFLQEKLAQAIASQALAGDENANIQSECERLQAEIGNSQSHLESALAKLAKLERELAKTRDAVKALEDAHAGALEELSVTQNELAAVQAAHFDLASKRDALEEALAAAQSETELAQAKSASRARELAHTRCAHKVLEDVASRREHEIAEVRSELACAKEARLNLEASFEVLTTDFADSRTSLNEAHEKLAERALELDQTRSVVETLEETHQEIESELERVQNERDSARARLTLEQENASERDRAALAGIKARHTQETQAAKEALEADQSRLEILADDLEATRGRLAQTEAQLAEAQAQVDERARIVSERERELETKDARVRAMAAKLAARQAKLQSTIQTLRAREQDLKAREDDLEGREAEVQIRMQKFEERSEASFHTSREAPGTPIMTPISQYASFVSAVGTPIPFQSPLLSKEASESPALSRKRGNVSSHQLRQVQKLEELERELGLSPISSSFLLSSDFDLLSGEADDLECVN